jgi:hypothetical protein
MNRLVLGFLAVVFVLFALPALAQDPTVEDAIDFWKPHEGLWDGTYDTNGKIEKGIFSFRRARNDKCFLIYAEGLGGTPVQQLQGYDPVAKKFVAWGFTADGSCWQQTISVDGLKAKMKLAAGIGGKWESRVSTKDGTTTTTTCKWTFPEVTENQLVIVWSDVKEGDKTLPDSKLTMLRRADQSLRSLPRPSVSTIDFQGITADDYVEYWKPLRGSWKLLDEYGGKSVTQTWQIRLARNGKCVLTDYLSDGKSVRQTIDGYDPGTKKWTFAGFNADGRYDCQTVTIVDMQKGKRLDKGIIGTFDMKGYSTDEQTTTATSTSTCTEFGDKRIVLTWTDVKENGKPITDGRYTLERLPENERRPRQ